MTTFTLTDLECQADQLTAQIEQLTAQRDALRTTAQLLSGGTTEAVTPSALNHPLLDLPPPQDLPAEDPLPIHNLPIHNLEDLDIDFTGARNLFERIQRIGRATEGHYLSLGLLAYYLEKVRPSRKGSHTSLRTHIRTCISKHPEHFQRVAAGVYRYYDTPRPRSVWQTDGYHPATDPEH